MFVLFSLSIFFLLCSMGQVAWNKTDDDDLPATLCVAGNNSSSVFVQWPWVTYNPHFKVTILVNVTLSLWIVSRQKFFFRKFIFFSLSDAKKFAGFYGTTIFEIWQKMAAISGWVDGLRVGTVGVAVRFQLIYQSNTIKWDSFAITRTEKFDRYLSYKTDDDDLPATLCVAGNNYLLTYLLTYLLGTEIRILWTHTPVCTTCKHFWKVGAQKQVSLKVMKSRGSSLEV